MSRRLRGFTLIELLVVISIIALLIGLLLPALSRARTSARVTQCLGNLRNINVGMETYSSEYGGVVTTGVPPETIRTASGTRMGTKPVWNLNQRIDNVDLTLNYGWMQRYWFTVLAPWCAKQDGGNVSIYADVFFCPDDKTYREQARQYRERETGIGQRISYLISDTAFWDPKMFTNDRYSEILADDMIAPFSDAVSSGATDGRVYLQKSRVKFPETKGYLYEPSAFHEPKDYGFNDCDQGANALFFDGHAQKMTMGTSTRQRDWEDELGLPVTHKMPFTQDDFACGDRDQLWWYYAATKNGIRGRDVKTF